MVNAVVYNGTKCTDIKLLVANKINIPVPVEKVTTYTAVGHDGDFIVHEGTYEDIEIEINFNFYSKNWGDTFWKAKHWLLGRNGDSRLYIRPGEGYYKVKQVSVSTTQRLAERIGFMTAKFTCDPYFYVDSADEETTFSWSTPYLTTADGVPILTDEKKKIYVSHNVGFLENFYDVCHPIYLLTGHGNATLDINGKTVDVYVDGNITIDTDRKISYTSDGRLANVNLNGLYEDLWLLEGDNSVAITKKFDLRLIPLWRHL